MKIFIFNSGNVLLVPCTDRISEVNSQNMYESELPVWILPFSPPSFAGAAVIQSWGQPCWLMWQKNSASPPICPLLPKTSEMRGWRLCFTHSPTSALCFYLTQGHHRCSFHPDFMWIQHLGGIDYTWYVSWTLYNVSDDFCDLWVSHIPSKWPKYLYYTKFTCFGKPIPNALCFS